MTTRDLGNKRVTLWCGLASAIADLSKPLDTEVTAMLNISPAVRWDGFDMGMQASDKVDDRTLDDAAGSQIRGLLQFGGGLPLLYPQVTDGSSILRQAYNLFKTTRTQLALVERIGFKSTSAAPAAGDNVNTYLVLNDGFKPDTEGDGGYAYLLQLLAQGTAYPWTKISASSPPALAAVGATAVTIVIATTPYALRGVSHPAGDVVTQRATWTSSDETKVTVQDGVFKGVAAGSATVTASFPGTAPVTFTVTVS